MNRVKAFVCSALLVGSTGLALAQDATPGAAPATVPVSTPAAGQPGMMKGEHPRIMEVRERLQRQRGRIAAAVKGGKMTKDEAKPLWEKLKSIRAEMQADIKSNGKTELTEAQLKQLNDELNANSEAIKDGQTEGGSATEPAASTTPSAN
jgi:small-conductance mechanosensitive channel